MTPSAKRLLTPVSTCTLSDFPPTVHGCDKGFSVFSTELSTPVRNDPCRRTRSNRVGLLGAGVRSPRFPPSCGNTTIGSEALWKVLSSTTSVVDLLGTTRSSRLRMWEQTPAIPRRTAYMSSRTANIKVE